MIINAQDFVMKCGCVVRNGEIIKSCPTHGGNEDED